MATYSASVAVGEVLRQPDDLVKLTAYRNKLLKEKSTLDAKLTEGMRAQLSATRDALLKLQESRSAASMIREEMIEIEKLKNNKDEGEAFDKITRVSTVHRNFAQTAKMVSQLQSMADKVYRLTDMLQQDMHQDGGPIGPSANLLPIHFQLHQLETFMGETLHAAKRGDSADMKVLKAWFQPLEQLGHDFDDWLWQLGGSIIELSRAGYGGTVVRLLKIVEFEGKEDQKAVAMKLMRKAAQPDAQSNFRNNAAAARHIKNYRHKLLDAMESSIKRAYDERFEANHNDLLGFIDSLQFIYKDIIRIKHDVEPLFPPDYEVVQWLIKRYHGGLNTILRKAVASDPPAEVLLELHGWTKEYRKNMKELEVPSAWLQPPLLDGKSQDLIEDYVRLIVTKLDEWTINLQKEETAKFRLRTTAPSMVDELYGMDGVNDFFQLVNQQIDLALDSNQGAVLSRVVTESAKVMRRTQAEWVQLVGSEARAQAEKKPDEIPEGLVEYVMALANDQLRAADYTEALQARLEPLVSDKYKGVIVERLNEAIDGYLDVAKQCNAALVSFVFNDLRPATRQLFQQAWYQDGLLQQIIETMRDYLSDYQSHLNPSIYDILVEDMLDAFLIMYLTSIRRAPANSLRMPMASTRFQNDVAAAFDFFAKHKAPAELEVNFQVMDQVASMLSASEEMVFMDYYSFAQMHGPQFGFVEALLRARDDLDRSGVSDIMDIIRRRVADDNITDPPEPTIMVKVQGNKGGLAANLTNLGNLTANYAANLADKAGNIAKGAGRSTGRI
ncbi:Exocyst complex component sec6 [Vanrija pseudolonga]|uniref:Exocyst complex component sec6 n=1 Tax=Vanrija pseudolonga TaxID=143232 RepID=A0AAF0Y9G2_9TREE|nr:Exocyst complex component sec6 [Vanrija pseudolonga]